MRKNPWYMHVARIYLDTVHRDKNLHKHIGTPLKTDTGEKWDFLYSFHGFSLWI